MFFKIEQLIKISSTLIKDEQFKSCHSRSAKDFTRTRLLPFELVLILVLRNSVKSLQLVVNAATPGLAFSQAEGRVLNLSLYRTQ